MKYVRPADTQPIEDYFFIWLAEWIGCTPEEAQQVFIEELHEAEMKTAGHA